MNDWLGPKCRDVQLWGGGGGATPSAEKTRWRPWNITKSFKNTKIIKVRETFKRNFTMQVLWSFLVMLTFSALFVFRNETTFEDFLETLVSLWTSIAHTSESWWWVNELFTSLFKPVSIPTACPASCQHSNSCCYIWLYQVAAVFASDCTRLQLLLQLFVP